MKQNRITTVQDLGSSPHSGKPLVMCSTGIKERFSVRSYEAPQFELVKMFNRSTSPAILPMQCYGQYGL